VQKATYFTREEEEDNKETNKSRRKCSHFIFCEEICWYKLNKMSKVQPKELRKNAVKQENKDYLFFNYYYY
jgi:hypothetical protein